MLKKITLIIVLYFILFIPKSYANDKKIKLAIFDLQPIGVSTQIAITVSDILRSELFKIKLFTILERNEMNQILKEQGFQQSGLTKMNYAVKIGKLLSANRLLVGTVNKLGNAYIIDARIIDVEKGVVRYSDYVKVESESELDTGCKIFAQKLSDKMNQYEIRTNSNIRINSNYSN